jgi:aminoglycoside 2''-phosphotransferase
MTDLTMAPDDDGNNLLAIWREIVRVAPEFLAEPIAPLGEGMDSLAVLVGGAAVFRFAKHDVAAAGLRREIALLPRLARGLSLAIPRFQQVGEHSVTRLPFVGYALIQGEPLSPQLYQGLPGATRDGILGDLASFLNVVHAFPVEQAVDCGVVSCGGRADFIETLQRARVDAFPLLDGAVRQRVESQLEAFLEGHANFDYAPALLHGDLWPEHLLFSKRGGRLAGVIDFGDVSIGDPDYDLAFLGRRLGSEFVAELLQHYPHANPVRLAEKIRCFNLFNAIDDVFIGLDRGDRPLVDSSLADLAQQI